MLNVQTLTNTLSRMPLPQLQQYAALHKNDPYVVTLALSIANQKKQMMAGQAGQAGMMPQPKVVDQDIAQMVPAQQRMPTQQQTLPEDQGIGQLPAQNMQRMAEGGIVAFDDGGSVPGYADGVFVGQGFNQNPLVPPPTQNRNALIANRSAEIATQAAQDELKRIEAQIQSMPPSPQRDFLENRKRVLLSSASAPTAPALPTAPLMAPALPPSATQVMSGLPALTPSDDKKAPPPPPPATVKPVAPVNPMAGIKALDTTSMSAAEAKKQAADLSDSTELRKQLESNEKFTTDAYNKLLGDYDKKIAEVPEAYKGYEERLKKEEAEAATDKDKALGMAIFQAGLGMMSGTSQYAFENIGKGALAGLENYQAALKDLKKAQRERDKAFGDIEAARSAEKRGDIKAHTELQAKGIDALGTAKNRTIEGIAKIFDVDTRTATGIFETKLKENAMNERTMYTSAVDINKQRMADAAALQRVQIQANAPSPTERILSNPALFNKQMELQTAGTETKGINAFALAAIKDPSLLPRLEAGSAQDRQLAAAIKQHMQTMLISPVNLPADTPLRP